MKTFKEYLAEAVKTYMARIKVAGELPENFETNLKNYMTKYETIEFKKRAQKVVNDYHKFFCIYCKLSFFINKCE